MVWKLGTIIPHIYGEQGCAATCMSPPYCIDLGCTSHISPVRSDFTSLTQIPHREVHGMSRVSIPAVATGTITLKCRKGRKITLRDALFVPAASLHLISVGKF